MNTELKESNKVLVNTLEFHIKELAAAKMEMSVLSEKSSKQDGLIAKLSNENKFLKGQHILETQTSLDNKQRSYNLVFEGVVEQKNENTKQIIINLITAGFKDSDPIVIDTTYIVVNK